jgi:hypothetical protein
MLTFTMGQAKELQALLADSLWSLERRAPSPATAACMVTAKELKSIVDRYIGGEAAASFDKPSDIAERLRAAHRPWTGGAAGCRDCGTSDPCASQRAADEIERLRRMLRPIGTIPENGGVGFLPFPVGAWVTATDISRAYQMQAVEGFATKPIRGGGADVQRKEDGGE